MDRRKTRGGETRRESIRYGGLQRDFSICEAICEKACGSSSSGVTNGQGRRLVSEWILLFNSMKISVRSVK